MKNLNDNELKTINGGASTLWYVIGGLGILLIGILDGIRNPIKCRS